MLFILSFFNFSSNFSLCIQTSRSSHQCCSIKRGVLRNFTKFTGKYLCQSARVPFSRAQACNLLKKRLWHRCFPVNFEKFLRTSFLQSTSGRVLLDNFFRLPIHPTKGRCSISIGFILCGLYLGNISQEALYILIT